MEVLRGVYKRIWNQRSTDYFFSRHYNQHSYLGTRRSDTTGMQAA
jgi:hypothetical protein